MQNHILSIILFTPLLGALVLLFVPKENKDAVRWIANSSRPRLPHLLAARAPILGQAFEAGLSSSRRAQQLDSLNRRRLLPRH
jgi:hypothetical protein